MITINDISNIRPKFYRDLPNTGSGRRFKTQVYQEEFLSELDPAGHKINNPIIYENIMKRVPATDAMGNEIKDASGNVVMNLVEIPIERISVPLQRVIKTKRVSNITAEPTKFAHLKQNPTDDEKSKYVELKNGWVTKNMETCKYEFIDNVESVGDAAVCLIMYKGKVSYKVFSMLNGDKLHPVYDRFGNIRIFGREYTSYDYDKKEDTPYLDVWDDRYLYTYKYSVDNDDKSLPHVAWNDKNDFESLQTEELKTEGWVLTRQEVHGFTRVPIEYNKRDMGACWTPVQDLIDKFELALSQLAENNKSYAFRIMILKGGFEIQGDLRGQARAIMLDENSDAKFLEKADASNTFQLQLETLLNQIFLGSFTVVPPEINGDTSGVTVKILYSPAQEQGVSDINFYNKSIDNILSLFKEGYGIEQGDIIGYNKLQVRADMSVYIPQNEYEKQQCITLGVQNGYLSKETAAEQNSSFSSPDEKARLVKQDEYNSQLEASSQRATLVGTV